MHVQHPPRREPAPSLGDWLRRHAIMAPLVLVVLLLGTGVGVLVGFTHRFPHHASGPQCRMPGQPVTWPSPATQVVSYFPTNTPVPVTVQVSETLEVDLPTVWQLSSHSTYAPVLTLQTPAGSTDASGTLCGWRFTAQQAGAVPLEFLGSGGCPVPGASCAVASFQVAVTVAEPLGARVQKHPRTGPSNEFFADG